MTLFLGTANPHKVSEFQRLAPSNILVLPAFSKETAPPPEIPETGETFFQNAVQKATATGAALKGHRTGIVFADDSGLVVPALNGEPGIRSARYAGEGATEVLNREALLRAMKGLAESERRATFVCVLVALDIGTGRLLAAARGSVSGHISKGLMGEGGFGYDPVFVPEGYRVSFGVMSSEEKNRISHRTQAFGRLCRALEGR
jgi:XTP/dITP diphosphohydrolase